MNKHIIDTDTYDIEERIEKIHKERENGIDHEVMEEDE